MCICVCVYLFIHFIFIYLLNNFYIKLKFAYFIFYDWVSLSHAVSPSVVYAEAIMCEIKQVAYQVSRILNGSPSTTTTKKKKHIPKFRGII